MQLNEKTDKIVKKAMIVGNIIAVIALLLVATLVFIIYQVTPEVLAS